MYIFAFMLALVSAKPDVVIPGTSRELETEPERRRIVITAAVVGAAAAAVSATAATAGATSTVVENSKNRRRLNSGLMTDDVCEAIMGIAAGDKSALVGMLTSGGDQASKVETERKGIIGKCASTKAPQTCKFYMEMLPFVDPDGTIQKAAWVDAMGSEDDKAKGCMSIVNAVNPLIDAMAADPSTHIHREGNKVVVNRSVVSVVPQTEIVDDGVSCKVVGGVAAGLIAGAGMVGVAIGTICKTFAADAAYKPLLDA